MYKRVLLKISGEQLQGKFDGGGFDAERAAWIADELKKVNDTEVIVVTGGGNYVRGAELAGHGVQRVTADYMGMVAGMLNAVAFADVLNANGVPARALTNIRADQIADQFTHRRALSHLAKERIVVIGGGIGRPYMTHDTAAVSLALELDCDLILKATKVDGVYDTDPLKNPDAVKYERLSLREAVERPDIQVMDKAAIALAHDHSQSIVVFELLKDGNIAKAIGGEGIGTTIEA